MAKQPANVYQRLHELLTPALKRAGSEVADMQHMIEEEGGHFQLQPWDWWYYAEKVKKAKYDLDEEMLRPYFKLENVRQAPLTWPAACSDCSSSSERTSPSITKT